MPFTEDSVFLNFVPFTSDIARFVVVTGTTDFINWIRLHVVSLAVFFIHPVVAPK